MSEIEGKNYYEILGVSREATLQDIKEAYREIARVFHPDSHFYDEIAELPLEGEAGVLFKEITAAYNTLVNEERRKDYDLTLPSVRGWEDEETEAEIDWRSLDDEKIAKLAAGREPRKRKDSGWYARGKFGIFEQSTEPPTPSFPNPMKRERQMSSLHELIKNRQYQRNQRVLSLVAAGTAGVLFFLGLILLLR